MDEYTPTTEHTRGYASNHGRMPAEWFDRWLEQFKAIIARDALIVAANHIDLDAIAQEWAERAGTDDAHWIAGNAAASAQLSIYNEADKYALKTNG